MSNSEDGSTLTDSYRLPERSICSTIAHPWEGSTLPTYVPGPREKLVLDAVQAGINAGIASTRDMVDFVAKRLAVSEDILARGKDRVENGDFGMDVYYARKSIQERALAQQGLTVAAALKLTPGQTVGHLVLNSGKPLLTATVESLNCETGRLVFVGSRRGRTYRVTLLGSELVAAINRAAKERRRTDDYDALVAAHAKQGAAPVIPDKVAS